MEVVIYLLSAAIVIGFWVLFWLFMDRNNIIGNYNQTTAKLMSNNSVLANERDGAIAELEKVTKERDELQAKLCKIKDNDIELLNLKIYKERVLARLKSIIDDEVGESFHS